MRHPLMIKAAAVGALCVFFAWQLRLFTIRRGDIHLDDNAILAFIGLGTLCYGFISLITLAVETNLKRRELSHARNTLKDAIDLGAQLAEDDAREKITQKTRRTMSPPEGGSTH